MIFDKDKWLSALEVFDNNVFGILKINLTTNSYEIIKNRTRYDNYVNASELLKSFADKGIIHPQDTRAYVDHVDLEYLRKYFMGEDAVWRLRCRCRKGTEFSWVMMEMHPSKDFTPDNKEIYMYLQDVDNEIFDRHIQQIMMRQKLVEERLMMQMANEVLDSGNWHIFYDQKGDVQQAVYDEKIASLYGYESPDEMTEAVGSWMTLVHPEDKPLLDKEIERVLKCQTKDKKMLKGEFRAITKNNGYRWFLAMGEMHATNEGQPYIFFGIMLDITARREYDAALQKEIEANERLQQALLSEKAERQIINSIASIYNTIHVIDLENQSIEEINALDIVHDVFEKNKTDMPLQKLFNEAIRVTARSEFVDSMLQFINLDTLPGRLKGKKSIVEEFMGVVHGWLRASFIPVKYDDSGLPTTVLFTTLIIDEQKRREENLIRISNTDELTRLYNRRAYENDIESLQTQEKKDNLALISIDVTGLKRINDSLGHAAGDELLIGTAKSLLYAFGSRGKVYRTGGDEFMVVLKTPEDELNSILTRLEEATSSFKGEFVNGIVLAKGIVYQSEFKDSSLWELEKIADKRMYADKSSYYVRNGIERRR